MLFLLGETQFKCKVRLRLVRTACYHELALRNQGPCGIWRDSFIFKLLNLFFEQVANIVLRAQVDLESLISLVWNTFRLALQTLKLFLQVRFVLLLDLFLRLFVVLDTGVLTYFEI